MLALGHNSPQVVLVAAFQNESTPRIAIAWCRAVSIAAEHPRVEGQHLLQIVPTRPLRNDGGLDEGGNRRGTFFRQTPAGNDAFLVDDPVQIVGIVPQTDGYDVLRVDQDLFQTENGNIRIVQIIVVDVVVMRMNGIHERKLGVFIGEIVDVVHSRDGQDPVRGHKIASIVYAMRSRNEMFVGDDGAAAEVGWRLRLGLIEQGCNPRELSFVHAFAVEGQPVEAAAGWFAAGVISGRWCNSGPGGSRTCRHRLDKCWSLCCWLCVDNLWSCRSRPCWLRLRLLLGPLHWLLLLGTYRVRQFVGSVHRSLVLKSIIIVLEAIIGHESIVGREAIRFQPSVQGMLQIDGGYDASLSSTSRADGLPVESDIEDAR